MSASTATHAPMDWAEFLALPEGSRGEYYDGWRVQVAEADGIQPIRERLAELLKSVLPTGYEVGQAVRWRPESGQEFTPDITVRAVTRNTELSISPVMVVEIIAPHRGANIVMKSMKYSAAGLRILWIIDPDNDRMLVHELHADGWEVVQTVTKDEPAEVDFGIASVRVDLGELLAP